MKIFIACSKWCYPYIPDIKKAVELMGHEVVLPNYYDDPMIEERIKKQMTPGDHVAFCKESFRISKEKAENSDAILVLNFDRTKNGVIHENYIGGATFLEMYDSYLLGHDIYLYNPIPSGILRDEIDGMNPVILNGDLMLLKDYLNEKEGVKKC